MKYYLYPFVMLMILIIFSSCSTNGNNESSDKSLVNSVVETEKVEVDIIDIEITTYPKSDEPTETIVSELSHMSEYKKRDLYASDYNKEPIKKPWTEELIQQAWKTTYEYEHWVDYIDRIFFDLTNDGIDELILTVPNDFYNRDIRTFQLINDELVEIEWLTAPIGANRYSVVLNPPTEEEEFNNYLNGEMLGNFRIVEGLDGNSYISKISYRPMQYRPISSSYYKGTNAFLASIYQVKFDGNNLYINPLYEWGTYWWINASPLENVEEFQYNKCVGYGDRYEGYYELVEVEKEEVQQFLDMVYYKDSTN